MNNESFLEYIRTILVILLVNEENIKQKRLIDKLIRDIDDQLKANKEQAEQKLKQIKQVCEDYCEQMCLCDSRETCKDCINTEILQIIDEVK